MRLSPGCSLGNEDHGEGGLACREGIRREAGSFKTRATRSQEVVRSILSRFGRRIRTDSIPARSCIGADHREVPGLRAEAPTAVNDRLGIEPVV